MIDTRYRDPIIALLIEKLEEFGPKELVKKYYYGNPIIIGQNEKMLPAGFISFMSSNTVKASTHRDRTVNQYEINVATLMKKDWLNTGRVVQSHMTLLDWIQGRGADMNLKDDCILNVLRKFEVLDGDNKLYIDLNTATQVRVFPGIEARGPGIFTYEATVTFNVVKEQIRASA